LMIAKYNDKTYVAVVTLRGDKTRIISVRRARNYEVKLYENEQNDK
jgi:uncharacterized DUF497 family protein